MIKQDKITSEEIKKDEFTTVERLSTGIVKKTTKYPDNNKLHLERETGNLELANKRRLPVVKLHSSEYDNKTKFGTIETEDYGPETLNERLNNVVLTNSDRVRNIKKALQVMGAIHNEGILLFDPNLDNFLVNPQGDIVVCDFGLSSSKNYPHRAYPPTSEKYDYYSKNQNTALEESFNNKNHALLNKLSAKDDLYVFATDIRRHLKPDMLSCDAWQVVDSMRQGEYETAKIAAEALPAGTPPPKPLNAPQPQYTGTPANWLKARPILITLALGGSILAGGIVLNNHSLQTKAQNELRQQAISSAAYTPAPLKAMSTSRPLPVEPIRAESTPKQTIKEVYRKEAKPDGSVLITNAPRKTGDVGDGKELLPYNTERYDKAATEKKTKQDALVKTKAEQETKKKTLQQKIETAKQLERKEHFSDAYLIYQRLKDSGLKADEDIARLENKTLELIVDKHIKRRKEGYKLLKAVADQQGNPRAKYYYGRALINPSTFPAKNNNAVKFVKTNKADGEKYLKKAKEIDPGNVIKWAKTDNDKDIIKILSRL